MSGRAMYGVGFKATTTNGEVCSNIRLFILSRAVIKGPVLSSKYNEPVLKKMYVRGIYIRLTKE